MILRSFDEMVEIMRRKKSPKRVAVVLAEDLHTLEALMNANKDNIISPILIGNKDVILSNMNKVGASRDRFEVIDALSPEEAARQAVHLIHSGAADFIMKGLIETSVLMKIVVSKESNLRKDRIMSHITFLEIPTYHKLLAISDAALNTYPNLDQKRQILLNAVDTLKIMGVDLPKVAVMAPVEEVNPKLTETVEAGQLKMMNQSGEIEGCIIEGPISYDLAINSEAAEIKGYESPVAGDVDLMIVPDLASGNLMTKSLIFSAKAKGASFVIGAKVPIVLTSRASTAEDKYLSLVLAASAC